MRSRLRVHTSRMTRSCNLEGKARFARRVFRQASFVVAIWIFCGVLFGALVGVGAAEVLVLPDGKDVPMLAIIFAGFLGGIGGYLVGQDRVFPLMLEVSKVMGILHADATRKDSPPEPKQVPQGDPLPSHSLEGEA